MRPITPGIAVLAVLPFLASCVVEREFCFKVYESGTAPPATCNSRVYNPGALTPDSIPTLTFTLKRGGPARLIIIETVLLSGGPSDAQANVYAQDPVVNGQPIGYSFGAPSIMKIPGTITLNARLAASPPAGDLFVRWVIEDDDTEKEKDITVHFIAQN
ncbi:MAG TPA: hypothetical protein VM100_11260 [Longimicrobiales bacterium]|nr:hypothetical protein [Longimicrobiales bacterium]